MAQHVLAGGAAGGSAGRGYVRGPAARAGHAGMAVAVVGKNVEMCRVVLGCVGRGKRDCCLQLGWHRACYVWGAQQGKDGCAHYQRDAWQLCNASILLPDPFAARPCPLAGMLLVPDSPRWLASHGKRKEAQEAGERLWGHRVAEELGEGGWEGAGWTGCGCGWVGVGGWVVRTSAVTQYASECNSGLLHCSYPALPRLTAAFSSHQCTPTSQLSPA